MARVAGFVGLSGRYKQEISAIYIAPETVLVWSFRNAADAYSMPTYQLLPWARVSCGFRKRCGRRCRTSTVRVFWHHNNLSDSYVPSFLEVKYTMVTHYTLYIVMRVEYPDRNAEPTRNRRVYPTHSHPVDPGSPFTVNPGTKRHSACS